MSRRVDIIGGGASGLAAAWYLAKKKPDLEVHVWEKDRFPGGLAGSFETEEFKVEKFYHHIFKRDVAIQELIKEVGLEKELVWRPAATGSYYFSQPYRLSSPLDVLKFKPLSFLDRLRLGGLVLHARTIKDWKKLDDISVEDYIKKVSGKKVYQVVWEPLLKGKFGKHASNVSAAWLWSKLVDRGGSRNRKGFEYLGYLKGGMGRLFEEISIRLKEKGHQIHLGERIEKMVLDGDKIKFLETSEGNFATDFVIGAAQLPDLASLLPDSILKNSFLKIPFLGNICLVLSLKKSLSDFYWTNITDPTAPFVGIVEQTNWADIDEFNGRHLVYISAYTSQEDRRWEMNEQELIDYYLPFIQKIFPDFNSNDILDHWLWRARYAQPIVTKGYHRLIPPHQTSLSNFFISTMAQIYPNDRQVSNGIGMAKRVVDRYF